MDQKINETSQFFNGKIYENQENFTILHEKLNKIESNSSLVLKEVESSAENAELTLEIYKLKVDNLMGKLELINEKFNSNNAKFDWINTKLEIIEKTQNRHSEKLDEMENANSILIGIKKDLEDLHKFVFDHGSNFYSSGII